MTRQPVSDLPYEADGQRPLATSEHHYVVAIENREVRGALRPLDQLIERTVPEVYKAVKYNGPLYGIEGQGWFMGFYCFTSYVKLTFFRGRSLRPMPPDPSKHKEVRYFRIYEHDELDETQLADWVKQARRLPGEKL